MTEYDHRELRRLFELAVDLPADERDAMLDLECGDDAGLRNRVRAMVAAAEDEQFLSSTTPGVGAASSLHSAATLRAAPHQQTGQRIDRYRLLQQLGEGGFGVVYLAEQEHPVRRRVALKIIKLGMDTKQVIARFEAERQALAMMDHPNIARVLDAGSTDSGRPYFVMELVKGTSLIEYCDSHDISLTDRLKLFMQVCGAVQHAHQKGIIHRDIKPSNILVTLINDQPVPKVIDFGIAKATQQRLTEMTMFTEFGQFLGTPAYMAPEQTDPNALDIDTRSDIYSLGVVLYELLTGTTPFDTRKMRGAALDEIKRIIREQEPSRPSTKLSMLGEQLTMVAKHRGLEPRRLCTILRGDLDWIILKALEKDRTRRYESASGLATDIERYLNDEPVVAGPPSPSYKLRKFVKRNRVGVTAASLVAAVLVLGVLGTSWGMLWALDEKLRADVEATNAIVAARAEQVARQEAQAAAHAARTAEAEAKQRAEELEQVADFQSEQLSEIDVSVMGRRLREDLLSKVRAAAERSPLEPRAIEDRVDEIDKLIADVDFTGMALQTLQENVFDRALQAIDAQFADQPLVRARLLQTMATTLLELGLLDLASDPQAQALSIRSAELGREHPDTLESVNNMGLLLKQQGKLAEAEPFYREALEGRRRVLGDEHPETLGSISNLGALLSSQGKLAEAEPYYREALAIKRRVLGDLHSDTLLSINNMGFLLHRQGKLAEAEAYYREGLEGLRSTLGDEHSYTLASLSNLGTLLESQGKHAEAEPYVREGLEGCRRVLGDEHPNTLRAIINMGGFLIKQGRFAEAEPYFREALDGCRHVLGDEHPATLTSINNMGILLERQGKLDEAEPYYREALQTKRRVLGDGHPQTLLTMGNLASLLVELGQAVEAEQLAREAVAGERRANAEKPESLCLALGRHGQALTTLNRFEEAEEVLLEAHGILVAANDEANDQIMRVIGYLVDLYGAWHEAEPDGGHDAAAAVWRAKVQEPDAQTDKTGDR